RMRHRPLETHEQSDSGSFETRPLVCLLLQQPQRSTLFPYTTLFRSRLEHLIALLLVDRGRDLLGTLGRTLLPPPAWLGARYEGRGSSRLGHYVAHYRRLGQVIRQATGGLGPPRPR